MKPALEKKENMQPATDVCLFIQSDVCNLVTDKSNVSQQNSETKVLSVSSVFSHIKNIPNFYNSNGAILVLISSLYLKFTMKQEKLPLESGEDK